LSAANNGRVCIIFHALRKISSAVGHAQTGDAGYVAEPNAGTFSSAW